MLDEVIYYRGPVNVTLEKGTLSTPKYTKSKDLAMKTYFKGQENKWGSKNLNKGSTENDKKCKLQSNRALLKKKQVH